jgi:hypothetical protein
MGIKRGRGSEPTVHAREEAERREIMEKRGLGSPLRSFQTWLQELLEADTVCLGPFF